MRIGIDVSQVVYKGTGVGRYVSELVPRIIEHGQEHDFLLIGNVFGQYVTLLRFITQIEKNHKNVSHYIFPFPPFLADLLWNTIHFVPIDLFIGSVDLFISSDWTQPALRHGKVVTTIHDLSTILDPKTYQGTNVAQVQHRRLMRVKSECDYIICDSEATKADCMKLLGIPKSKLDVVYPGRI